MGNIVLFFLICMKINTEIAFNMADNKIYIVV